MEENKTKFKKDLFRETSTLKDNSKNRGITLIALVITILVILILAGVTIATLTGDNGLLTKAGKAKQENEKASEIERIQVEVAGAYDVTGKLLADKIKDNIINNITGANAVVTATTEGHFPVKVTLSNGHKYQVTENGGITGTIEPGDTAPNDANATYTSGNYTAIIPAGFTVSATESSIENGLVVTDSSDNEWVWIPVSSEDLTKMYEECYTNNELLIENSITKVATSYKSKSSTDVRSDLIRDNPNSTDFREPGLLSDSSYDRNDENIKTAGFVQTDGTTASLLEVMATELKNDYKDMIESLRENGGFYIGRYELGKDTSDNDKPQVKAGTIMNGINWYISYKACKSFSKGNVESRMVWGCQWDQVCRFIHEHGDKVNLANSKKYGNYNNSEDSAATNKGSIGSPALTGKRNEEWKTNNIYDLAGNCWEWIQEARGTSRRAIRGRSVR